MGRHPQRLYDLYAERRNGGRADLKRESYQKKNLSTKKAGVPGLIREHGKRLSVGPCKGN